MFSSAALHDPVFRDYVGIVAGLLLGAGLVLAILQFGFRVRVASVWETWRSWLWMAALAALAIAAGRVVFTLGVMAVALLAFREFARTSGLNRDRMMGVAVALGIGLATLTAASQLSVICALVLIALVPILRDRSARPAGVDAPGYKQLRCFSLGVIAFVYLGWMFGQLGSLAASAPDYGLLCFVLFATAVCDVAGFICGKLFGRHLLCPAISPRKTLEGSLGALGLAMILPWLLRFSFPFFGARELILAGLIIGLGGQLGDLSLSFLKREFGIKDWGTAIPGHGGVLDRIDSLIFVAPLFILLLNHYLPGR